MCCKCVKILGGRLNSHLRNSPGIDSVSDHVARHLNVAGTRTAVHACAHCLQEISVEEQLLKSMTVILSHMTSITTTQLIVSAHHLSAIMKLQYIIPSCLRVHID